MDDDVLAEVRRAYRIAAALRRVAGATWRVAKRARARGDVWYADWATEAARAQAQAAIDMEAAQRS
jgi:hypothetical protein